MSLLVVGVWPAARSDPQGAMRCHVADGEVRCAGETRGLTRSASWDFHEDYEPLVGLQDVVEVDTDGTDVFARTAAGRVWQLSNRGRPGRDRLERVELPLEGVTALLIAPSDRGEHCAQVGTSWRCRDLRRDWPMVRDLEGVKKLQLSQRPDQGGRLCALDERGLRCFQREGFPLVQLASLLPGVRDFAVSEAVLCTDGADGVKCVGEWASRRVPLEVDAPPEPLIGWAGDASRICAWSARTLFCAQELGDPVTRVSFVAVEGVEGVKRLELDASGGCGEDARGRFCFGVANTATPRKVPSVTATRLSVSSGRSCALSTQGVTCWGSPNGMDHRRLELPAASSFEVTDSGACTLADGKARLVGRGVDLEHAAPGAVTISCDRLSQHACFVDAKGRASCFGANDQGQLASPASEELQPPTRLPVSPVRALELVASGTALLDAKGEVWLLGQLWFSESVTLLKLRKLGWPQVTSFSVDHELCAISRGRVRCTTTNFDARQLAAITDPAQVSVGSGHACVLRKTGKVVCVRDAYNATTTLLERGAEQLTDVVELAVAAGGRHACARHTDGAVSCWGEDFAGQLGGGEGALGVVRLP